MSEDQLKMIASGLRMIAEALDPQGTEKPKKSESGKPKKPKKSESGKPKKPKKKEPKKQAKLELVKAEPKDVEDPQGFDPEELRQDIKKAMKSCGDLEKAKSIILSFGVNRLGDIPDESLAEVWAKLIEAGIVKADGKAVLIGADDAPELVAPDTEPEAEEEDHEPEGKGEEPELTHQWFAETLRAAKDRKAAAALVKSLGARVLGDVQKSQYRELYNLMVEADMVEA